MKKAKQRKTARSTSAIDQYIAARTRDARNALGMSQAELGAKLGVTFQQVQKYENARNRVSAARLFDICEVLGIPLASMFERKLKT